VAALLEGFSEHHERLHIAAGAEREQGYSHSRVRK
jgi:hypothetical protein